MTLYHPRPERWPRRTFGRWHMVILATLWLLFTVLTYLIVSNNSVPQGRALVTTASTAIGPMTGAICRDCQSCCLANSLILLPYCLIGLTVAIVSQLLPLAENKWSTALRLFVWFTGLLVWFAGGIASFFHALS